MTFFCGMCGSRGFGHQIEGNQQVPSIPVIVHELRHVCIPTNRSVSFIAEFHFTTPFINLYLFISAYIQNKEIMNSYKEMYVVLKFTVVCHIILLLLAVLQCCVCVKGKLSGQGFEGCETSVLPAILCGSSTVVHLPGMPVSKVCYFRHCSWFVEIDPGFKLAYGVWVGLCINRNGPFYRAGYCSA